MCSNKPSRVCPHYGHSTCNIHCFVRQPQYECQKTWLSAISHKPYTITTPARKRNLHLDLNAAFAVPSYFGQNTTELHIFRLIGTASPLNMQKIWIIDFSLKTGYIGSLKFGCYYLQTVPASKLSDHALFEVPEAITLYCA